MYRFIFLLILGTAIFVGGCATKTSTGETKDNLWQSMRKADAKLEEYLW